jgi:hypothetical protein
MICQLIDRERLTYEEAWKAAGGGEHIVEPEHADELIGKIDRLYRGEQGAAVEHGTEEDEEES